MKYSGMQLEGQYDTYLLGVGGTPFGHWAKCRTCGEEEYGNEAEEVEQCERCKKSNEPEVIEVTLSYDAWAKWFVHEKDYDAEWNGERWRGSHTEYGKTMEEALQNYRDYLEGEGKENFVLEITGPNDDVQVHADILRLEAKLKKP